MAPKARKTIAKGRGVQQTSALRKTTLDVRERYLGSKVQFEPKVVEERKGIPSCHLEVKKVECSAGRLRLLLEGCDVAGRARKLNYFLPEGQDSFDGHLRVLGDIEPLRQFNHAEAGVAYKTHLGLSCEAAKQHVDAMPSNLGTIFPLFRRLNAMQASATVPTTIDLCDKYFFADNLDGYACYLLTLHSGIFGNRPGYSPEDCRTSNRRFGDVLSLTVRNHSGEERSYTTPCPEQKTTWAQLDARTSLGARIFAGEVQCFPKDVLQVGHRSLHPWQAWFLMEGKSSLAECRRLFTEKTESRLLRFGPNAVVRSSMCGFVTLPRPLTILVAEPGAGKTYPALLLAQHFIRQSTSRFALCLFPNGTRKQWGDEGLVVGLVPQEICASTNSLLRAKKAMEETDNEHLCLMTRSTLGAFLAVKQGLRTEGALKHAGPLIEELKPALLIVDEFQSKLERFSSILSLWPNVPVLGLAARLEDDELTACSDTLHWNKAHLEAALLRVPQQATNTAGNFPTVEFFAHEVPLTELELTVLNATADFSDTDHYRALIYAAASAEDQGQGAFATKTWEVVRERLKAATSALLQELASLLEHEPPVRRQATEARLREEFGNQWIDQVVVRQASLEMKTVHCSATMEVNLERAKQRRDKIMNGNGEMGKSVTENKYFLSELVRLNPDSKVNCIVCCMDQEDWAVNHCGHIMCQECLADWRKSNADAGGRCVYCRAAPAWRSKKEIFAWGGSIHHESKYDTSSRLNFLCNLLKKAAPNDRVLVVCPKGSKNSILLSVWQQLARFGFEMGKMVGSSEEQEIARRRWTRGRSHGLLCDHDIKGVSLSTATCVIFLTAKISLRDFEQAKARVVRQGNCTVAMGRAVHVHVLYAGNGRETTEEWLRTLEQNATVGNSYR